MAARRAHFIIIPLGECGWGIRVKNTVFGQFPTEAAASKHAIQWGRRMASKGVEVRVLISAADEPPRTVWTSELPDELLDLEFETGPSKDALPQARETTFERE